MGLRRDRGLARREHARRGAGLLAGTDEQKRAVAAAAARGAVLCSFALTEPNAGSDVSGIQTTAERHGDEYVLNGSKMFITNAGHAAWFVVFASTDGARASAGSPRSSSRRTPRAS